jgi:uncharacterized membrane protein
MISKLLQETAIAPIAAFHTSLLLSILSLSFKDLDPNGLVGIRTPRTLNNPEQWKLVHARAYRIMPCLSGICVLAAVSAFWIHAMRTPAAALVLVGVQVIALFFCASL